MITFCASHGKAISKEISNRAVVFITTFFHYRWLVLHDEVSNPRESSPEPAPITAAVGRL
jgi:hypothetical protein